MEYKTNKELLKISELSRKIRKKTKNTEIKRFGIKKYRTLTIKEKARLFDLLEKGGKKK